MSDLSGIDPTNEFDQMVADTSRRIAQAFTAPAPIIGRDNTPSLFVRMYDLGYFTKPEARRIAADMAWKAERDVP